MGSRHSSIKQVSVGRNSKRSFSVNRLSFAGPPISPQPAEMPNKDLEYTLKQEHDRALKKLEDQLRKEFESELSRLKKQYKKDLVKKYEGHVEDLKNRLYDLQRSQLQEN